MDGQDAMVLDPHERKQQNDAVLQETQLDPSTPRRNSIDDPNPARKRQRIDDSDTEILSASVDDLARSTYLQSVSKSASPEQPALPATPDNGSIKEADDTEESEPRSDSIKRNSSKVTINIRPPRPESSHGEPIPSTSPIKVGIESDETLKPIEPEGEANRPISIRSSPSTSTLSSPKIEVSESDDNDYPVASEIINIVPENVETLYAQFPSLVDGEELSEAVSNISQILESGDISGSNLLGQLSDWIDVYLTLTGNNLEDWYELWLSQNAFWDKIPGMFEALLKRNVTFGPDISKDSPEITQLQRLLVSHLKLVVRFLEADFYTLELHEYDEDDRRQIAWAFMRTLQLITRGDIPLYQMMQHEYGMDGRAVVTEVLYTMVTETQVQVLPAFERYYRQFFYRLKSSMNEVQVFWYVMEALRVFLAFAVSARPQSMEAKHLEAFNQQLPEQALSLFRTIESSFRVLFENHLSSISKADMAKFQEAVSGLLLEVARTCEESGVPMKLYEEIITEPIPNVTAQDIPDLVYYAWRFALLMKVVTVSRMDLRVQGITRTNEDLVKAFTTFGQGPGGHEHPLMQFLALAIQEHKLIEYIVGVDSHPELIVRSANIPSFLAVTHTLTKDVCDFLWNKYVTAEDQRVGGSILQMIRDVIQHLSFEHIVHFCELVTQLPLTYMDQRFIDFGNVLLTALKRQAPSTAAMQAENAPYDMCIRLIRDATSYYDEIPNNGGHYVHDFAYRQLLELAERGPSTEYREKILVDCVERIKTADASVTGSCCVVSAFLRRRSWPPQKSSDVELLTEELQLGPALVKNIASFIEKHRAQPRPSTFVFEFQARLDLLLQIIMTAAPTITQDMGVVIWDYLVGENALGESERDQGWHLFCQLAGVRQNARNEFLDRCLASLLPTLNPKFFTVRFLDFLQKSVEYSARVSQGDEMVDDNVINIPGAEQFWRVSLTALTDNIAARVISFLVQLHLDTPIITKAPPAAAQATHIAFVERCVSHIISAAASLKKLQGDTSSDEDSMVIVPSSEDVAAAERHLLRSLLILQEFLTIFKQRPQFAPPRTKPPTPESPEVDILGDTITMKCQAVAPDSVSINKSFTIGSLATVSDLKARICKLTGFAKFRCFWMGHEIDFQAQAEETLESLKVQKETSLLIRLTPDDDEGDKQVQHDVTSPVEAKIIERFDELYDLFDLDDGLARVIFHLLRQFPPQLAVKTLVCSDSATADVVFPRARPYKILYSTYALRSCLEEKSKFEYAADEFLLRSSSMLISALMSEDLLPHSDLVLKISVSTDLTDCLIRFLKEPVSPEVSAQYFKDPESMIHGIFSLITLCGRPELRLSTEAASLSGKCFGLLLESSLHNTAFWTSFKSHSETLAIVKSLILVDARPKLRQGIAEMIVAVSKQVPMGSQVTSRDLSLFLWNILGACLLSAKEYYEQSEHLFQASLAVFRLSSEHGRSTQDLESYLSQWSNILLSYRRHEVVGSPEEDYIVSGFARLLSTCVQIARVSKRGLNTGNLSEKIFQTHLFPKISMFDEHGVVREEAPVQHSPTRSELYRLLLVLNQDQQCYEKILDLASDLVPPEYFTELTWHYERDHWIRSSTGYVGLRNLSNTCYLNSLFTQLYMNPAFRQFIFSANITDAKVQKLLLEVKRCFVNMQNSWQKCYDPHELTDSILSYDGASIDVCVQMDVDEFYNLLSDRLESQILDPEQKRIFRGVYGGQLVQQVKSKECMHISEREEPFSAIQCDIKGKSSLEESLRAYVEGEVMEGDNKYSCTQCNRHVNAVKRTCLKQIPDNLIFHLKRFDFDLRTMQRNKINDHFQFPETIDMMPYGIEHLSDPDKDVAPDQFELVGILVHSGTAESGHYYSFIRERPTNDTATPQWIEFNDADVSSFDSTQIGAHCFGGPDVYINPNDPASLSFQKLYSAYMLFYQRSSSLKEEQQRQMDSAVEVPLKFPVPVDLGNATAVENEVFLRKYCIYDSLHSEFVRSLLEHLYQMNLVECSEDHEIEQKALYLALDTLDQIIIRTKGAPDFDAMMTTLNKLTSKCTECCNIALTWHYKREDCLRNLVLRCPELHVRTEYGKFVLIMLSQLKEQAPLLYGLEITDEDQGDWEVHDGRIHDIVDCLATYWDLIHINTRNWDTYFGLLNQIVSIGMPELSVVLRNGFLEKCLELLTLDYLDRAKKFEYARLINVLEKKKKKDVSYYQVIELVNSLLKGIDLEDFGRVALNCDVRAEHSTQDLLPLTRREVFLLRFHSREECHLFWVTKMLDTNQNPAAVSEIIRMFLCAEPKPQMQPLWHHTLTAKIGSTPASAAGPYLVAGIVFCETAPNPITVKEYIRTTAKDVETIGSTGGKEHLHFFHSLARARNARCDVAIVTRTVVEMTPCWAPALLAYCDESVRDETRELLDIILFDPAAAQLYSRTIKFLGEHCMTFVENKHLTTQQKTDAHSIETIMNTISICGGFLEGDERQLYFLKFEELRHAMEKLIVEDMDASDWNDGSQDTSDSEIDVDLSTAGV